MNILFLTLGALENINDRGIYPDLVRIMVKKGHEVFVITPNERRNKRPSEIYRKDGLHILKVKTLNIQKTNYVEKTLGILLLEYQYKRCIKKFIKNIKFDLILYSTPPISFTAVVKYFKKRDKAASYLLLKDIFPQNAVDLKIIQKYSLAYLLFRQKERELYRVSDRIGCLSPANVEYLLHQNPCLDKNKIHVNPNSIELSADYPSCETIRKSIRSKFSIPGDSVVFIYGGNLGKPQGLDFLINLIESKSSRNDLFFIIAGSGTEYKKIKDWINSGKNINVLLFPFLPKAEFDELLAASDVGMIFLDPRFTIPNFPSRLLSYLEFSLPVLTATDVNTDIGRIAEEAGFGFWCENGDLEKMSHFIDIYANDRFLRTGMGKIGHSFLKSNYTVEKTYSIIFNENVPQNM